MIYCKFVNFKLGSFDFWLLKRVKFLFDIFILIQKETLGLEVVKLHKRHGGDKHGEITPEDYLI